MSWRDAPRTIRSRTFMPWTAALSALLGICFVVATACIQSDGENTGFENFVGRAQAAEEEGWTAYWLGREFEAGGLTFYGPSVDDFTGTVENGVNYNYSARGGLLADLRIVLKRAESRDSTNERGSSRARSTDPLCTSIPAGSRPVNQVRCIIEFPDTIVTAIAPSLNADPPGSPNQNPLLDVDLLLSVLENLRPYPE